MVDFRTQQFSSNYYSGTQASIHFGDIFVDEIQSIQFDAITNRSPIYGYGSTHFDAVAEGNFLINGAFAINYVHQDYLIAVLAKMIRPGVAITNQGPNILATTSATTEPTYLFEAIGAASRAQEAELKRLSLKQLMNLPSKDVEILRKRSKKRGRPLGTFYNAKPFDIHLDIGETKKTLGGVILTSSGQMVGASGEPLMETYRFLARVLY